MKSIFLPADRVNKEHLCSGLTFSSPFVTGQAICTDSLFSSWRDFAGRHTVIVISCSLYFEKQDGKNAGNNKLPAVALVSQK